jgi:hypothetical protein
MRGIAAAAALAVWGLSALGWSQPAQAAGPAEWRITKTEWSAADEQGFRDFIKGLGHSHCNTTAGCLRDPANPYRGSDPASFHFISDCADLPYMLRAYYAWKNGLPFAYVDSVEGGRGSRDIRYTRGNKPESRHDVVDNGDGINGPQTLDTMRDAVSSATYRTDAAQAEGVMPDFYPPKLDPGSIKPGTAIYDVNGHVALVYDIDEDGRIYYMDAHPDHTLSRSVYGAQFGQSRVALGGGFKNWRPIKLVGAVRGRDGAFKGGHIVAASNAQLADFSLEQYAGNVAGTAGDGANAQFAYNNVPLGFFEYVRVAVSGGKMTYNPVYELRATMRTLCNDMEDRAQFVAMATREGIVHKAQPRNLPDNIYATDDDEWEIYSTPSRDARLKTAFAAFYQDLSKMIDMYQARDPRITYDGLDMKADLKAMYAQEAAACHITYTNSVGRDVTLDFPAMAARLFTMDFDPYHCVELRWGASDPAELASCVDDSNKRRWYAAEQRLRNQPDRTYDQPMGFSLADLEQGVHGSGIDRPPPTDIAALIDSIGARVAFTGMTPVGH